MFVLSCVALVAMRAMHPVFDAATRHDARQAVYVPKTTKTQGSSITKLEKPLFREFLEAICRYNLIPTSCCPNEK